ncbi:MAG: hypothetical protein NVS3B14_02620 [Ktedonobacteraceae bacterium]
MSHSLDQAQQNAQNAVSFFGRPGLPRLVNRLYEKYAAESQVRGQVILSDSTPTERHEIASFLGKPLYSEAPIRVKLADVEKALLHSFSCTLPDMLLSSTPHYTLHYSGDFDARGLQIAAYLLDRYPGRCHPWHFDPDTYMTALQPGGIQASAGELALLNTLSASFAPLVTLMQVKGMWAYQEGIADLLINDIKKNGGGNLSRWE